MPRISIATVMLVIVLAALDLAAWRAVTRSTVHEPSNLAEVIVALLPTLNIVAVLAYHFARRVWRLRREGKPITLPDRLILALGIVTACLYLPSIWILFSEFSLTIRFHERLLMWSFIPGVFVIFFAPFLPGTLRPSPVGWLIVGSVLPLLLVGLVWLGSCGRWQLILAAIIALLVAVPSSFFMYAGVWM